MLGLKGFAGGEVVIMPGAARLVLHVVGRNAPFGMPPLLAYTLPRGARENGPLPVGMVSPERVHVVGLGEQALRAAEEEPGKVHLVNAIHQGRCVGPHVLEAVLRALLKQAGIGRLRRTFGGMVCRWLLTPDQDEGAWQTFRHTALNLGFRQVHRADMLTAALAGAGLDIRNTRGSMVLKLGSERSVMALYTMGENVTWMSLPFGGRDLDAALVDFVARRHKLRISTTGAQEIKHRMGSLYPQPKPNNLRVNGLDGMTGVEKKATLDDNEIRDVLTDACEPLVMAIQEGFHKVPPELAADIARDGVLLTGGGANMLGIAEFLGERTGLFFVAPSRAGDLALEGASGTWAEPAAVEHHPVEPAAETPQ